MFRLSKPYFTPDNLMFFLLESVLIATSIYLAFWLGAAGQSGDLDTAHFPFLGAMAFIGVVQLTLYYNGMYEGQGLRATEIAAKIAVSSIISSGILTIGYYVLPEVRMGGALFILSMIFCTLVLMLARLVEWYFSTSGKFNQRILIIGTGKRAQEMARLLLQREGNGYTLVGFIECCKEKPGVPHLYSKGDPQVASLYTYAAGEYRDPQPAEGRPEQGRDRRPDEESAADLQGGPAVAALIER